MNNNLAKWQPCKSICQIAGAACLILSIKNSKVLLNGPRWCSILAERELACAIKEFEERLYCSEIQETDLLYGAETNVHKALQELLSASEPELLGVLTSCAMSLIGDDVHGFCQKVLPQTPKITLDVGGLTGEFFSGYQKALQELLLSLNLKPASLNTSNRVNIWGVCAWYPNWQGDLTELKRLLKLANIDVNLCIGEPYTPLTDFTKIPQANLNVILQPELALDCCVFLQETLGQKYLIAPAPYGLEQSQIWLNSICTQLNLTPELNTNTFNSNEQNQAESLFALKNDFKNLYFARAFISAPTTTVCSLVLALQKNFPDLSEIYIRPQSSYVSPHYAPVFPPELKYWTDSLELPQLQEHELQILFGAPQEREELGAYNQTIYLNFYKPDLEVKLPDKGYVGVTGWNNLLHDIIYTARTLSYINLNYLPFSSY